MFLVPLKSPNKKVLYICDLINSKLITTHKILNFTIIIFKKLQEIGKLVKKKEFEDKFLRL